MLGREEFGKGNRKGKLREGILKAVTGLEWDNEGNKEYSACSHEYVVPVLLGI